MITSSYLVDHSVEPTTTPTKNTNITCTVSIQNEERPVLMHPLKAMERLFFAIFGQARNADLMINAPASDRQQYRPDWTKVLFKIVFATYMLVTVVVLVKLLIATMSDTYQQIQAQSDIEWKFGLSKLIRNIDQTTTLPSPINLITTWFFYLVDLCRAKVRKMQDESMSPTTRAGNRWLSKLKKDSGGVARRASVAASMVMKINNSFESQTSYTGVQAKFLEYVTNWKSIVKKYRMLMEQGSTTAQNQNNDDESEEARRRGS